MSQELSNWYRDNFNKLSSGPEDDVWKKISSRLDAAATLQKKKRSRRLLAFILLLFVLGSSTALTVILFRSGSDIKNIAYISPLSHGLSLDSDSGTVRGSSKRIAHHSPSLFPTPVVVDCMGQSIGMASNQEQGGSAITPMIAEHYIINGVGHNTDRISVNEFDKQNHSPTNNTPSIVPGSQNQEFNTEAAVTTVNNQYFNFVPPKHYTLTSRTATTRRELLLLESRGIPEDEQPSRIRNSYIGIYGNIKNSYLLNAQTYSGFSRHGFDQTHFMFTSGYGLRYGHYITHSINLEAQVSFRDKFEQRYTIYEEGKVHGETVTLNGFSAGITARIRSGSVFNRSLYLVVGGQCMFVRTYVTQDSRHGTTETDSRLLCPLFTIGAEQELFSLGNYQMLAGLRSNIGLSNLTGASQQQHSGPNETRISDLSLYFSIQRSFVRGN